MISRLSELIPGLVFSITVICREVRGTISVGIPVPLLSLLPSKIASLIGDRANQMQSLQLMPCICLHNLNAKNPPEMYT